MDEFATNVLVLLMISAAGLACALSWQMGHLVKKFGIVDRPDGDRKTQSVPVARLGGLAIFAVIIVFLLLEWLVFTFTPKSDGSGEIAYWLYASRPYQIALGVSLFAFLIGLWDDIGTVPTKLKLALLAIASLVATYFGLHPDALNSPLGNIIVPAALIIGSALWLLVFTNAANFMDGSNGLSIGSMAIMLGGLAISTSAINQTMLHLGWFALLGAIAGFLIHNLRGKLYMGDAGALGLGALFASLGLASGLDVWTVATLALPFLIDVLLTLLWRAKHKRSLLQPHRDHAYQRLIDSGWSHIEVAVLYWGLSAACAVAAIITATAGGEAPFVIFWTLTLAGIVMWSLNRREYRAP